MAADAIDTTAPAGGAPEAQPAAPAQPQQGQPQAGPWDEVLGVIPADLHDTIRPHFDGFSEKLTEATQGLEAWKPYEEMGLREVQPENLKGWFEWMGQLGEPESAGAALQALAASVAQDLGVDPAQLLGAQPQQPAGDEPGSEAEQLRQRLDELQQRLDGRDEADQRAQVEQEERQRLETEWQQVREQHGRDFTDEEMERLRGLAKQYAFTSETPVKDAYEFINSLTAGAQNALVETAPTQPSPAERGGRAATTATPPDSFEDAERLMRERRAASTT
ncbi:MAG TPA: hypothetical protein VFT50_09350 [Baekduia sp.]|nr:hypothetical protein [Baekduia sp.]